MEEQEFNLKEEIRRLKEKVESEEDIKKNKKNKFKIGRGRLSRKNIKDNYITVCYIQNNRNVDFFKVQTDEATAMIKGIPRITTVDETLYYKGKPIIIMPEWSVKPFSPSDNYNEAIKNQQTSEGYTLLMNRMQKEAIALKKKMNTWLIIAIIAVIGVAGFFLLGGTKLFAGAPK